MNQNNMHSLTHFISKQFHIFMLKKRIVGGNSTSPKKTISSPKEDPSFIPVDSGNNETSPVANVSGSSSKEKMKEKGEEEKTLKEEVKGLEKELKELKQQLNKKEEDDDQKYEEENEKLQKKINDLKQEQYSTTSFDPEDTVNLLFQNSKVLTKLFHEDAIPRSSLISIANLSQKINKRIESLSIVSRSPSVNIQLSLIEDICTKYPDDSENNKEQLFVFTPVQPQSLPQSLL